MAQSFDTAPLNLGFLTVLHEPTGYLGGYLVTNRWGRPLEFRVSTAVQPNRVHQILYGGTLQPYICADLIGKALVEKAAVPIQLLITDREPVLDLRLRSDVPVVWLAPAGDLLAATMAESGAAVMMPGPGQPALLCHPRFVGDVEAVKHMLATLDGAMELDEPFGRIREAINEARKMGVTSKAA